MTATRFTLAAATAAAVTLTLHGCGDQPTSLGGPGEAPEPSRSLTFGTLQDVPAVTMDLPPSPRPWDLDDGALVEALEKQEGHAVIAFKASASARAAEAEGRRAALPVAVFEQGLELLEDSDAETLYVYRSFGAAYARIDPSIGPKVRQHPLVDYVEPRQWSELAGAPADAAGIEMSATAGSQTTPWGISLVRAPEAWTVSTGSGVRVQVIDTGVNPHEDLPDIPGANCGGQFDGCRDGPFYHGTHVAGSFFAKDNTIGVIGVAQGVSAQHVYSWGACSPTTGGCSDPQIAAGIDAGRFAGVRVINISTQTDLFDQGVANAVAHAWATGTIVLVAAAGNVPPRDPGEVSYPAGYTNVIGVSGVRQNKSFASTSPCGSASNHGPHVDLSGPFWALSTVGTNSYEDQTQGWCGTSFAAPHVSGAAALVWAENPNWSNAQVRDRLFATAEDLGTAGRNDFYGHGLVDAAHAVGIAPIPPDTLNVSISGPTQIQPEATCTWEAVVSGGTPPYSYSWSGEVQPTGGTDQWYTGGKDPAQLSDWFRLRVDVSDAGTGSGWHEITVTEDGSAPVCIMSN